MDTRSKWIWTAAVGAVAIGAGAAMAAGLTPGLNAVVVDAGLRAYARGAALGHRLPLEILLPVVAVSVSFSAGSRMGRHARRAEARAIVVPAQPPVVRTLILFGLAVLVSLFLLAAHGLGG